MPLIKNNKVLTEDENNYFQSWWEYLRYRWANFSLNITIMLNPFEWFYVRWDLSKRYYIIQISLIGIVLSWGGGGNVPRATAVDPDLVEKAAEYERKSREDSDSSGNIQE